MPAVSIDTSASDDAPTPRRDRQHVTALARGLAVLRAFSPSRRELGSSAIARITGLPQPTVWRLCKTLLDEGYLLTAPGGDRFMLSPAVLSLGFSALATVPLADMARAPMQDLADRYAAGVSLGLRDGRDMILVQRCQGVRATLVLNLHIGSRLPLAGSAIGSTYLAALPETERQPLLAELEAARPERWAQVIDYLAQAQEELAAHGYFANVGVFHRQINTVALPFRGSEGRLYVLTCGAPAERMPLATMRDVLAPDMMRIVRALGASP
jgi:DNA-binding IclR family transcriptional regulator